MIEHLSSLKYYQKALEILEQRKKNLEKHEADYRQAMSQFNTDYENVQKT